MDTVNTSTPRISAIAETPSSISSIDQKILEILIDTLRSIDGDTSNHFINSEILFRAAKFLAARENAAKKTHANSICRLAKRVVQEYTKHLGNQQSQEEKITHIERFKAAARTELEEGLKDLNEAFPLHYAVRNRYPEIVKRLLKNGADVNEADNNSCTPLHFALREGRAKVVRILCKHQAKFNQVDKHGAAPLHTAASKGQVKVVKVLLSYGANINQINECGAAPLHFAASSGHVKVVKVLCDYGANFNQAMLHMYRGATPLHFAANGGYVKILRILCKYGAEVNGTGEGFRNKRSTPLQLAVQTGILEAVKELCERGADVNQVDDTHGDTPLHVASTGGYLKIVQLLCDHGAKINTANTYGCTPLNLPTSFWNHEVSEILRKRMREPSVGTKFKIPLNQGQFIWKFQFYTDKRGYSIDYSNEDLNGLTILHMYYCFTRRMAVFFDRLYQAATAKVVYELSDDLSTKPLKDLTKTEEDLERMINDTRSLQKDIRTENQSNPLSTLKLVSEQKAIHDLKSSYRINAPFKIEAGAFQSLENLIFTLLNCDGLNSKYLLISKINHIIGVFYDGEYIYLYNPRDPHPQYRTYRKSRKNIHHLVQQMEKDFLPDKRDAYLKINVISGPLLNEINPANETGIDCNGFTPLYIAASNGHLDVVKILIMNGADVNHAGNDGSTPLHIALANGHLDVVKILIMNGADVNHAGNDGSTPLHVASANGHLWIVKLLIEEGAYVKSADKNGATPLHIASQNGYKVIANLLRKAETPVFANSVDQKILAKILNSMTKNDFVKLEILLRAAKIEESTMDMRAEFQSSIDKWAHEVFQQYNKHLRDQQVGDEEVNPSRRLAAEAKAIKDRLVNCYPDESGDPPLHIAIQQGLTEVKNSLCEEGADVNQANSYNFTPLHLASFTGDYELVKKLLNLGAIVDPPGKFGKILFLKTPLQLAAEVGSFEVVKILCENRAKVSQIENLYGNTALHFAAQEGYVQIAQFLCDKGAKLNTANYKGSTPLDLALANRHDQVAEILRNRILKSSE